MADQFSSTNNRLFVAGFMRGYRVWSKPQQIMAPVLGSVAHAYVWLQGRNLAECMQLQEPGGTCCANCAEGWRIRLELLRGHKVPSINGPCTECGFYAIFDPDSAINYGGRYLYPRGGQTYGSIKATGNVVIGERGFRAQIAEIEALAGDTAQAAAEYYGVPWYSSLDGLAVDYPPQDPGSLAGDGRNSAVGERNGASDAGDGAAVAEVAGNSIYVAAGDGDGDRTDVGMGA